MSAQFTVEDIRLINLNYSLANNEDMTSDGPSDEDAVPVPVEVLCNSNYDERNRLLKVTVAATIKDPKVAFTLSAEIGGLFQLDSDPDKEVLTRIRHINCPAILFPYLREVFSEITRRGGFAPVYLPPMDFVRMHRSSRESQEESVGVPE